MGTPAENVIATFDQLPDAEKQEVAAAILRRTLHTKFPPLSDEELVLSADETFLELERREAEDAIPTRGEGNHNFSRVHAACPQGY